LAIVAMGAAAGTAAPVFKVSFRVTGVTKSRPPNVVEIRLAAAGDLSFDEAPSSGKEAETRSVSAKVAIEFDILTPHPRTEEVTLTATPNTQALYTQQESYSGGISYESLTLSDLRVAASTAPCAKVGARGNLYAIRGFKTNAGAYTAGVDGCGSFRQHGVQAPNSRVHVRFTPQCLRTPAGLDGKPLCGSAQPDLITIAVNGAVRGMSLATGALTCTGAGFSEGTSCYVYAKPGSTVPATATIDHALPSQWGWKILWQPYGGEQSFPCPTTATSCTSSIAVPDLGGTVQNYITVPGGYRAASLYVVACKTGEVPYPGHPCPF
jgi:hypothetical protein